MSERRETQESIHRWAKETFGPAEPGSPRSALRLLAEAVELCVACGASDFDVSNTVGLAVFKAGGEHLTAHKQSRDYRQGYRDPAKAPAEAADVLVTLYVLAGREGFDLHAETDAKMTVNRARRWKAFGDGTGQHIRDIPLGSAGEAQGR